MDRKGYFILVVCAVMLLAWPKLADKLWPVPPQTAQSFTQGTNFSSDAVAEAISPSISAANTNGSPTEATEAAPILVGVERGEETLLRLDDGKATFVVTSHGGGLRSIDLNEYLANNDGTDENGQLVSINTNAPSPIMALGGASLFNKGNPYELVKSRNKIIATSTLTNGLKVTKTFTLTGTNYLLDTSIKISNPSKGPISVPAHELITGTATGARPKEDPLFRGVYWQFGEETDQLEGGWFDNRTLGCFPGTPNYQFTPENIPEQINWLATYNQFFTVAVLPKSLETEFRVISLSEPRHEPINHDDSELSPTFGAWLLSPKDFKDQTQIHAWVQQKNSFTDEISTSLSEETIVAMGAVLQGSDQNPFEMILGDINRQILTKDFYADHSYFFDFALSDGEVRELKDRKLYPEDTVRLNRLLLEKAWVNDIIPSSRAFQASFLHAPQILQPGEALTYDYTIYAGPKKYSSLTQLSEDLNTDLEEVMDFGGFFGFFSKILLLSMNKLHGFGISYGWTIVCITIIIKILFWPLTRASTRSMKRMAKIQPELKAIREKYKEDPQKLNVEMMAFMKAKKVSPLGGCLPMVIQMPIFFGFFFMIKSAIELRGASFLWASDLSVADTIFTIPALGWIPFLGLPGEGLPINPMPILMCVTMLYQMSLTPQAATMDPTQQKIMKFMPLMFILFLYSYSSGLTLYWTVNNILSIIQTKLVKQEDDEDDTSSPATNPTGPGPKPKKKVIPTPGNPEGKEKRKRIKGIPKR
ncbi:membrane protein insertase YidC [Verrucomicrobia bacterium]|nr:membrane protein insertase YidC [Verrucomicrobiota bacterium]